MSLKKPCKGCGGEKPNGAGRALCNRCRDERRQQRRNAKLKGCVKCGGEKERLVDFLCAECRALTDEVQRIKDRRRKRSKPACRGCGRPKGPGKGRAYCDRCVPVSAPGQGRAPRTCACGRSAPMPRNAKQCTLCRDEAAARRRERDRLRRRKDRQDPAKRERMQAQSREYHRRVKADPKKAEREREAERMRYRLKRGVNNVREFVPKKREHVPRIDTEPLREAVRTWCTHVGWQYVPELSVSTVKWQGLATLAEWSGVNESTLFRIANGDANKTDRDVAEKIIVAVGLDWQLVYGRETAA